MDEEEEKSAFFERQQDVAEPLYFFAFVFQGTAEWKEHITEAGLRSDEVTVLSLKEIKWRFGFFSLETRELNGEPLRRWLLNYITKKAMDVGGVLREFSVVKDAGGPVRGVLGQWVHPAYRVRLKKDFRKKLLEQVEKET